MFDFSNNIFTRFMNAITQIYSNISGLPEKLDAITFDESFVVTQFLGLIHYVLGDPLWILFSSSLMIGIGFIMYRIAKVVINLINSIIPKLKGRFLMP